MIDNEEWYEDQWLASRMPHILKELKNKYPDMDISLFLSRAEEGFVPNPISLEKTGKKENIILAGLIHREYALVILAGIIGIDFSESGRAIITRDDREIDVTDELMEVLPNLASACGLSIKNLAIDEVWEKDIDELINVISLVLHMGVFLGNTDVLENILSIMIFILTDIANRKIKQKLGERIYSDLSELGLEKLGQLFIEIASPSS